MLAMAQFFTMVGILLFVYLGIPTILILIVVAFHKMAAGPEPPLPPPPPVPWAKSERLARQQSKAAGPVAQSNGNAEAEVYARLKSSLEHLDDWDGSAGNVRQPQPQPVQPAPAKPRPTRQQVEDAGPVVHPKWDGTHKWSVGEDKKAWDRDFKEAEEWAEARLAPPGRGSTWE
jgi:hypothetical protein